MLAPGLETIACNLCGSRSTKLVFTTKDYRFLVDDRDFSVVRCTGCGLVYVNPRPDERDIHRYYNNEFYNADESPAKALASVKDRILGMAAHLDRYPKGRLLDIGCYRGEFIYHMNELGWDAHGIEFSSRPPNLFGQSIFYGDIANAPFAEQSFDVVTIWAVFEHVYDPRHVLKQAHRLLRPGGTLIILVPNYNSLPARFMYHDDVPRHVTMFTPKTLGQLLEQEGFTAKSWECGQDVYGGSTRGWLNFLVKRLAGEPMGDIQAQNRSVERWHEFSRCIAGKERPIMKKIDDFDIWLAPRLDRLLDRLMLGFIMTVHSQKRVAP
ncbi:class I SAM-dependent methyltransferase [Bradyrhizobium sp. LHD-71]|uniref:class I SAM-dependent methyltransferase n=1 Tax=Bradyrhizobium sp. LHD-71 TaxID=3072141 RepID=UPI00280FD090|nr:class I SAM-dependent methyltransferase [Bradyrhizobium sp. LHD-71]MDQ8728349.1 class I SAM-dependent methyltransferase [Bradyrhizobium sp. LHD-71]